MARPLALCQGQSSAALARQIEALAGQDPVRSVLEPPAIGLINAPVAHAGAIVTFGDRPQGVARLDDVPAGERYLRAGQWAARGLSRRARRGRGRAGLASGLPGDARG